MKKIIPILQIVCCLFWINSIGNAHTLDIRFKHLNLDEGLSQNSVFCMLQDMKGFLWFGTQDGLNKYDGYNFTIYKPDPDDPNSLSFNWINALCEDRDGQIWIGTNGQGVDRFDPQTQTFFRYPVAPNQDSSQALNGVFVSSICQDKDGNIWVATLGSGLDCIQRKEKPDFGHTETFIHYRNNESKPHFLPTNFISYVYQDRAGVIWAGTPGAGLLKFNRQTETFTSYRNVPGDSSSLGDNNIFVIYEDSNRMLWIGTNGGVYLMDRENGTFKGYRNIPDDHRSLSSNFVSDIYEDRSGVLWIATQNAGINRFDKRTETFLRFRHIPGDPFSLSNDSLSCIMEDRSRVLWLGTNGGGLNRFDRERRFEIFRADPNRANSLSDSFIYSVFEDHKRILWIGTNIGGLNRFDRLSGKVKTYRFDPNDYRSVSDNWIRCIMEDRNHRLWVGTQFGGLNRFHRDSETFTRYINRPGDPGSIGSNTLRHVIEDSSGDIWIATFNAGLDKYNPETETFSHYVNDPQDPTSISENQILMVYQPPSEPGILWLGLGNTGANRFHIDTGQAERFPSDPDDPHSVSYNTVLAILEDSSGTLWLGTYGGGLNKVIRPDQSKDGKVRFVHYTEKHGLSNNSIYGILEDGNGNLWLSTNRGLSQFDPKTEAFKNYNVLDGLQGNEFNAGAYFKNSRGEMFFGGLNGLNVFRPGQINPNPHVPPVVVTDFQLFHKPVQIGPDSILTRCITWTDQLYLNYKQNSFSFQFSALDYTIPEKNKYAYRMEGLEENWNYTDSQRRFAAYTNMSPGDYVFRVKGSNNDGTWNEEGTAINIYISPPYWQTWWFRIFMILAAVAVFLLGYRKRLRNERLKVELQTAHDAQMSIMPQTDPKVEGFQISGTCIPANEVGGDFFDYIWMNEEKSIFGIAIGDVSGKAMKSAMTAVMTSGMIYSRANEGHSVREVLQRVNRPLYLKTGKNVFTALCLAALSLESRTLTFTNAGLHAPLLKSAANGTVVRLPGNGDKLPLGINLNARYLEKSYPLESGDTVVFFTDGITESQNLAGDFYGDKRLRGLLEITDLTGRTASEVKECIIRDIKRFSENAPQHDDMTLVVVKVC